MNRSHGNKVWRGRVHATPNGTISLGIMAVAPGTIGSVNKSALFHPIHAWSIGIHARPLLLRRMDVSRPLFSQSKA